MLNFGKDRRDSCLRLCFYVLAYPVENEDVHLDVPNVLFGRLNGRPNGRPFRRPEGRI